MEEKMHTLRAVSYLCNSRKLLHITIRWRPRIKHAKKSFSAIKKPKKFRNQVCTQIYSSKCLMQYVGRNCTKKHAKNWTETEEEDEREK